MSGRQRDFWYLSWETDDLDKIWKNIKDNFQEYTSGHIFVCVYVCVFELMNRELECQEDGNSMCEDQEVEKNMYH